MLYSLHNILLHITEVHMTRTKQQRRITYQNNRITYQEGMVARQSQQAFQLCTFL